MKIPFAFSIVGMLTFVITFMHALFPLPRESSVELTIVGPLGWLAFFTLVYCLEFFTPKNRGLYLMGGGGGLGIFFRQILTFSKVV